MRKRRKVLRLHNNNGNARVPVIVFILQFYQNSPTLDYLEWDCLLFDIKAF